MYGGLCLVEKAAEEETCTPLRNVGLKNMPPAAEKDILESDIGTLFNRKHRLFVCPSRQDGDPVYGYANLSAQNLTGVALEINAANKLIGSDISSAHRHLDTAAKTLSSCRELASNAVRHGGARKVKVAGSAEAVAIALRKSLLKF